MGTLSTTAPANSEIGGMEEDLKLARDRWKVRCPANSVYASSAAGWGLLELRFVWVCSVGSGSQERLWSRYPKMSCKNLHEAEKRVLIFARRSQKILRFFGDTAITIFVFCAAVAPGQGQIIAQ